MHIVRRSRPFILALLLIAIPLVADAISAPRTFKELSDQIVSLLSSATLTLVLLGVVIYLWGIASHMTKLSEGEGAEYKNYIFWGIAILFVMVSIWGILRVLQETVFSGSIPSDSGKSVPTPSFDGGKSP